MLHPGCTLLEDARLEGRNTFRLPATAWLLADVRDSAALDGLLAHPAIALRPLLVLGAGSNLVFAGDFPGTVLSLSDHRIEPLASDASTLRVRAAAGCEWNDLVQWTLARGGCGLENLIRIPGTVGAAPIQNIGAYGTEVGEFITVVEAFDREAGRLRRLDAADCGFGYRDSVFKREAGRWIVCAVEFALPRQRATRVDYAGVREELAALGLDPARPSHVAEAIARIRTRKLPDPAVLPNAGSFFKNPAVPAAQAEALAAAHPGLPVFPAGSDARKLSAAWMIEACGLKGAREGDAGVSAQHALVLVNHGHARGQDVLVLTRRIQQAVAARFGVDLEPEPRIIGAPDA